MIARGAFRALLVAVLLLAATAAVACGRSGSDDAGTASYGNPDDASGPTTSAGGDGEDGEGDSGDGTATTRGDQSGDGDGGGGGGSAGASRPTTTVAPRGGSTSRPVTVSGPPGSYARPVLRASEGGTIVLDVLSQAGAELRRSALDHLVGVLERESGKQVTLASTEIPGTAQEWSADDLIDAAETRSPNKPMSDRHVLHLLAVHGRSDTPGALGIAVRGDVAAVFTDQVDAAATPLVSAAVIETAVATHELGHLLGLVDLALETGRGDPDHPGHSRNHESVMYWAIESDLVTQVLGGPPSTEFDADDRADLARLRAGA